MTSTISELRDALEEALKKSDNTNILAQINAFEQVQDAKRKEALISLLDVVRQNDLEPQYGEAIADALVHYGDVAIPELLISLLDSSDTVRRTAYNVIDQSEVGKEHPDAVQQLAILRDNKPDLTLNINFEISKAVDQLKVGDQNTFFTVYDALKNSELKHLHLPYLLDLLKSNVANRNVANAISSIIASYGWVALPFLIKELHTAEKSLITGRVIDILGQIGSPLALPTLETITVPAEYEESVDIAVSRIDLLYGQRRNIVTNDQRPSLEQVKFSSYCPSEIILQRRYQIITYAYLGDFLDEVEKDIERFKFDLGGNIPAPRPGTFGIDLADRTKITIIPECDEISFDPIELTKNWSRRDGWIRFNFDFHSPEELLDHDLVIRLSVRIHGIEVTHIKHMVTLSESLISDQISDHIRRNPLATAKMEQVSAKLYDRIFISYSRQDKRIVEMYRLAQMATGNDVFMDTYNIRTGENWRAALARAIDIFQLFWSENSAKSENVKDEWDYALRFRCLSNDCSAFIRPVYWHNPMPAPPIELSHINFRFVPF
jgi:TIR domain